LEASHEARASFWRKVEWYMFFSTTHSRMSRSSVQLLTISVTRGQLHGVIVVQFSTYRFLVSRSIAIARKAVSPDPEGSIEPMTYMPSWPRSGWVGVPAVSRPVRRIPLQEPFTAYSGKVASSETSACM
jgi:hypothetical protein